jgi:hypothetical protein
MAPSASLYALLPLLYQYCKLLQLLPQLLVLLLQLLVLWLLCCSMSLLELLCHILLLLQCLDEALSCCFTLRHGCWRAVLQTPSNITQHPKLSQP